jgi:hypothetical protein
LRLGGATNTEINFDTKCSKHQQNTGIVSIFYLNASNYFFSE